MINMHSIIHSSYIYNDLSQLKSFNYLFRITFFSSKVIQANNRKGKLFDSINTLITNTFPSETQIEREMNKRKNNAIFIKSQTKDIPEVEDILKSESSILEGKSSAITKISSLTSFNLIPYKSKQNQLIKIFSLNPLIRTLSSLYNKTDFSILMKDLYQSYSNVKYNINMTRNPMLMLTRDLIEKISFKSSVSRATEIIKKYRPDFDICVFEKEMKIILRQMYNLYMNDDSKGLQMICGESAYAILNNEIKNRKEKGVELKYKRLIYIDEPVYQSAEIIDQDNVIMKVRVTLQECTSLIDAKTKKIVNKGVIESNQYMFDVIRNPVPFEEEFGHCYMVVNFQKIESTPQLF